MRMYATASAISEVLEDFRKVKQKKKEKEENYRKRLNETLLRCGNIHSEDGNITIYIDELSQTINVVVDQHRQSVHRRDLTFERLCHFTKSKDKTNRARPCHINCNINNRQCGRNLTQTHVVLSNTIQYPQSIFNLQQPTCENLLEDEPVLEEEEYYTRDVSVIEAHEKPTTEAKFVDELIKQTEEQP